MSEKADAASFCPKSSQTVCGVLGSMAQKWIEKEEAWYSGRVTVEQTIATSFGQGVVLACRKIDGICKIKLKYGILFCPQRLFSFGSESGYSPIDNAGRAVVSSEHLWRAKREYASRFAFCTEEEDAASDAFSGSPYLLVATNVKSSWTPPKEFESLRFMLVPVGDTSALFITLTPGFSHGTADGAFSDVLGTYLRVNHVQRYALKCHSGGETYQPDVRVYPCYPDKSGPSNDDDPDSDSRPFSRLMIDFEYGNRNASGLREVGYAALDNDFSCLFLAIKIWKKTKSGVFGAAAVLWQKDHATGNISLQKAFDFGTKQLSSASRLAWHDPVVNATPNRLPPVLPTDWSRPLPVNASHIATANPPPGQAAPIDATWLLTLPKNLIFYRTPTSSSAASPDILTYLPGLPDFECDLKEYQWMVDRALG